MSPMMQEWFADSLQQVVSYGCVLGIVAFDRQGLTLNSTGYREYEGLSWQETAFGALNLQFLLSGLLGREFRLVKVDYLDDLTILILPRAGHYLAALLVRN